MQSSDNILAVVDNWSKAVQLRDGLSHVFRGEASYSTEAVRTMVRILEMDSPGKKPRAKRRAKRPARGHPASALPDAPSAPAAPARAPPEKLRETLRERPAEPRPRVGGRTRAPTTARRRDPTPRLPPGLMSGRRYTGRKVARDDMSNRAALLWGGGVLLAIAIYVAFSVTAFNGLPWKNYRTVYATVPATGNLIKHDQVRIAGVRVGQLLGSEITEDGQAKLKLQLEPGTEIPEDTKVFIRANGLLGARYIQLEPGKSSRMLSDGGVIKGTQASFAYGVPEFLNTFDADTRTALGKAVRELGAGMVGNGGRLNETIDESAAATEPFQRLIGTILARPGAAENLLPSLNRLAIPLKPVARAAGRDVRGGRHRAAAVRRRARRPCGHARPRPGDARRRSQRPEHRRAAARGHRLAGHRGPSHASRCPGRACGRSPRCCARAASLRAWPPPWSVTCAARFRPSSA